MVIVEPSGASQEVSPSSFSEFLILLSWGSAHRCLDDPRSLLAAAIVSIVMRRLTTLGAALQDYHPCTNEQSESIAHLEKTSQLASTLTKDNKLCSDLLRRPVSIVGHCLSEFSPNRVEM